MRDVEIREEVQAVDALLARLEELPEGQQRADALAAVEGLLRLYGEALRRVTAACPPEVLERLRSDELVSQLLLLHDLHPAPLSERIAAALEEVRPYMGSHGGGIELVEVRDGVARVRLEGTCNGCAASTVTLKLAVEEAVLRAAPELSAVEAVDQVQDQDLGGPLAAGRLLPMFDPHAASRPRGQWIAVAGLDQLEADRPLRLEVEGSPLIVASVDGQLYAYADHCPGCRAPFDRPGLSDGALSCGGCGRRYDVRQAGVGLDGGLLQLDPVPLLTEGDEVRVAIEAVLA